MHGHGIVGALLKAVCGLKLLARRVAFCGALMLIAITSCSPPTNTAEATNRVIAAGFMRPGSTPGELVFGPGLLSRPYVSETGRSCEGSIGSIIPPIAIMQCVTNTALRPLMILGDLQLALNGVRPESIRRHVYLNGIERYWVHQSQPNDCWAATLETARRYLHLHPVSQDDLIESAQRICPALRSQQRGADLYQIVTAIRYRLKVYDERVRAPGVCLDDQCILDSLTRGRPVIMLGSGHAVLVVGLDYVPVPGATSGSKYIIDRIYVLDPAGNGEVEARSPPSLCNAEAFVFY